MATECETDTCPEYDSGRHCNPCGTNLYNGPYKGCGFFQLKRSQEFQRKMGIEPLIEQEDM